MCLGVRRIEKALLKLDGVTDARVNLATEVASITYEPELVRLDDLTWRSHQGRLHRHAPAFGAAVRGPGKDRNR